MSLNQDKTAAQTPENMEKVFSTLKKSVDKRLKEDNNPCKINENRLREISMHSLELLDCVGCTGGRAEIDKNTCDMVEINIWGHELYISDPMKLYEISRSSMGFFISRMDGGQAKMEIMFDKVLVRK